MVLVLVTMAMAMEAATAAAPGPSLANVLPGDPLARSSSLPGQRPRGPAQCSRPTPDKARHLQSGSWGQSQGGIVRVQESRETGAVRHGPPPAYAQPPG